MHSKWINVHRPGQYEFLAWSLSHWLILIIKRANLQNLFHRHLSSHLFYPFCLLWLAGAVHLPRVDFVSRLETNPVKINRFILPAYHNQTGDSKNQMPLTITYEQFHSQSTKESSSSSSRPPSAPARLMEPAKNGSFCFTSQSGQAQFFQLPPSTSSTHSPTLSPQMPSFNYVSSTPSYSSMYLLNCTQRSLLRSII